MQMAAAQANIALVQSQVKENEAQAMESQALAYKAKVEADVAPEVAKSKIMNAISNNLPNEDEAATIEFDRRVKVAELMLKEEDVKSKKAIVTMQMQDKQEKQKKADSEHLNKVGEILQ